MNRDERRLPADDPFERLQEESGWSPFTLHVRATNQGKLLFPSRHLRGWRAVTLWVLAAIIIVPFAIGIVAMIAVLVQDLF